MQRLLRIVWLPVALLGCAAAGCGPQEAQLPPSGPPDVDVSQPVVRRVTDYEEFPGQIQAPFTVSLRCRVTGYLEQIHFKPGAEVEEGQLLFEIDPRLYKAELQRTEANVVQATAHLNRTEADLLRAQSLLTTRSISREEYDKYRGDRDEAAAAVGVARAQRDYARENVNYTKVRAPISGQISRNLVDRGNLVKADDTILTTIVSQDPMHGYFDVDERTLLRLRRLIHHRVASVVTGALGSLASPNGRAPFLAASALLSHMRVNREFDVPVEMGLVDEEGFPHAGVINFVDNQLDTSTGTLRVRGQFPNPARLLSPGLFVRVRLQVGDPHQAVLVADQALRTDQGQKRVYVVRPDNTVEDRLVQVGRQHHGLREITDGLKPGERVVVSGLQRVRPNAPVLPTEVPMPVRMASTSTPVRSPAAGPAEKGAAGPAGKGGKNPAGHGAAHRKS